jgi:hypothetical protein
LDVSCTGNCCSVELVLSACISLGKWTLDLLNSIS